MRITANGIVINYALEGPASAPVVTLSHSLATHLSMWDPQIPALVSRYRVLRYDARGHGRTDGPDGPYSLGQLAEDARALLQVLGVARTHFIGLSMGGFVAQGLALRHPELVRALVLANTAATQSAEGRAALAERARGVRAGGMAPLLDATMARWITPAGHARLPGVLAGLRATLARADMTMEDLVYVQVFCPDVSLWETFNKAYRAHFGKDFPARAFVGSGPLLLGGRFEVQGIAVRR